MRMAEVCGGRARSPEASVLAGLSRAEICGFCMFFSVNNVLCVPACFHRSCGSAAMCVGYMRVAWHANGRPAEPWKARHVPVSTPLLAYYGDVPCGY